MLRRLLRKRVIPVVVATAMILGGQGVMAGAADLAFVNAKKLNVKKAPDVNSKVIIKVKKDEAVTVYGSLDGWCWIRYGGKSGFVREDKLIFNKKRVVKEPSKEMLAAIEESGVTLADEAKDNTDDRKQVQTKSKTTRMKSEKKEATKSSKTGITIEEITEEQYIEIIWPEEQEQRFLCSEYEGYNPKDDAEWFEDYEEGYEEDGIIPNIYDNEDEIIEDPDEDEIVEDPYEDPDEDEIVEDPYEDPDEDEVIEDPYEDPDEDDDTEEPYEQPDLEAYFEDWDDQDYEETGIYDDQYEYTDIYGERQRAVEIALGLVGNPYVYGGNDPVNGIDCSGFTQYVYGQVGISTARTAAEQLEYSRQIEFDQLEPGDCLYYDGDNDGEIDHVSMYIGGGQMVHASDETTGIIVTDCNYGSSPVSAGTYFLY